MSNHWHGLARGLEAALPRNLPTRWLRVFTRDVAAFRRAKEQGKDDSAVDIAAPLLVVIALINGASPLDGVKAEISDAQVMEGLARLERGLYDVVGRETGVYIQDYNLDNIV